MPALEHHLNEGAYFAVTLACFALLDALALEFRQQLEAYRDTLRPLLSLGALSQPCRKLRAMEAAECFLVAT